MTVHGRVVASEDGQALANMRVSCSKAVGPQDAGVAANSGTLFGMENTVDDGGGYSCRAFWLGPSPETLDVQLTVVDPSGVYATQQRSTVARLTTDRFNLTATEDFSLVRIMPVTP